MAKTKTIIKSICIFGAGGSARETYWIAKNCGYQMAALLDIHNGETYDQVPILSEDYFDPKKHLAVVAIGNSVLRKKIAERLWITYGGHIFVSLIDPSVIMLSPKIKIGIGAVIAPQCVLTCDISIGNFCQLNVGTSIMHDNQIGDYLTTAPGVRINGKITIGHGVYFGSNASTKEEITIGDNVIIGAGAVVIRDIMEPGTYVGVPAKKIK
jgi:sugar O-acyltransferase (sialic acid O-acetyltransferase NeuD family)